MTVPVKIIFFLLGTLIMIYVMGVTGKPLKTPATPYGILNLELAYNQQKVDTILRAWSKPTWNWNMPVPAGNINRIKAATINTGWDFLFLFFYSLLFFYSCQLIGRLFPGTTISKAGFLFSKLALIAGLFDIIENVFMLSILNNHYTGWYLPVMVTVSGIKWVIVMLLFLFCVTGLLFYLIRKIWNKPAIPQI